MAVPIQYYVRFQKENGSIVLTRTFNGKEDTSDVTEDIARLEDMYKITGWSEPENSLKVGKALFSLLNSKNNLLRTALTEADAYDQPVQLFIQGEDAVPTIPFEVVCDSSFLAPFNLYIIHHVSNYGCKKDVHSKNRPLRILFMACSSLDVHPVLDYESEEETILKVTETLPVEMDVEDTGSLQGLAERLVHHSYDVVHISGHANIHNGTPTFVMEDEEGYPVRVTPAELWDVLKLNPPRLLFLSGCRTGEAPYDTAVVSFAHQLVLNHNSTVLGWGLRVSDPGARLAAACIYFELGRGHSIGEAVLSARQELFNNDIPDWPLLRLFSDGTPLDPPLVTSGQTVPLKVRDIQYAYLENSQIKVLKEGFIGRRRQIQRGIRCLKEDGEKVGLVLHGTGGLGKSCLAGKLCERFKEHALIVVHGKLSEFSFFEAAKGAFIRTGDREGQKILEQEIPEKIQILCSASFQKGNYLIVLDDFEKNLELDSESPVVSEEAHHILEALLHYLPLAVKRTQLIITSRYTFPLIVNGRDRVKERLESIGLTSFRGADERKKVWELEYLREYHDVKVRKQLIEAGRGNPRLMEALNMLVKTDRDKDVTMLLDKAKGKQEEFVQILVLQEILHSQANTFNRVLQDISVYRSPVSKEGIEIVCKELEDWEYHVDRAVQLGLLEEDRRKVSYYWVTPLLREELFLELEEGEKMRCRQAAVRYYEGILLDTFVPEYAFELIHHGLQSGMITSVLNAGSDLLEYLRENLLYVDALRVGRNILAREKEFDRNESSSRFFFQIGWLLYEAGNSKKAVEYFEKALDIDREIYGEHHPAVATRYNTLGLAWYALGDSRKAIDYYEKSYKIFQNTYGDQHPHTKTVKEALDILKSAQST
ncbi:MAG: tetratricopeptide repeat protein [Candidatus Methanofastidiosia archaeon]